MKLTVIVLTFLNYLFTSTNTEPKRIFYINSYHQGYPPSDEIFSAIKHVCDSAGNIDLRTFFLDSKRQFDLENINKNVQSALFHIKQFNPDLIIASDDDAVKYLIVPYFKDKEIPIIFCGVNWSANQYGLPAKNITGMVEVLPLRENLQYVKKINPNAQKMLILSENSTSEQNNKILLDTLYKSCGFNPEYKLVNDFTEWKDAFITGNKNFDLIYLPTNGAIKNWEHAEAETIVFQNIKIPVITCDEFMIDYASFGMTKIASEQGEWAAKTALEILNGKLPKEIGLTKNKKIKTYKNKKLQAKLNNTSSEDNN